jgi:O-antigen/teichoic acid export membrane protein
MTESFSDIVESSARGGMFLFVGYFLSLVFLSFGSIVVARLLGPEGNGLYTIVFVVPSLILGFIDPGVGAALTRFTAKFRAEGRNDLAAGVIKRGFLFKFPISSISSLLCFIFSDDLATIVLRRPDIGIFIKISSLMILSQTIFNFLGESFLGLDKMEGNALILDVEALVKSILSPVLIILGFGIIGALAGHIISFMVAGLIGGILLLKFYHRLGKASGEKFISGIRGMISYGFPLYNANLLNTILAQIQILILAFFVSNADIGNFNVAVSLLTLVGVLTYPFSALFPAFSKVKAGSHEHANLFKFSVKYTAILIVPVSLMVAILSKDIIFTLYGRVYNSAPFFLSLYVLTNLYAGLGSVVFSHLFNGAGETRLSFYSTLINFVVLLPFAYILTQSNGVFGLLISILISTTCSFAFSLWAAIKKIRVRIDFSSSFRVYLASFLSSIPTLLLSLYIQFYYRFIGLILYICVFLFLYFTLLPIVGAIEKSDVENIRLLFKSFRIIQPLIRPVLIYEYKLLSIFKG